MKANKEPIDIITDFKSGEDHIDLSAIGGSGIHVVDSLTGTGGAEALFKGNLLSLDIDGDGSSDLDIQLNGVKSITDADFL
ncbi:MAG: M10 family metallopeptidase C-terminal domain-containing protein [Hyphomicrobiales bacterium]